MKDQNSLLTQWIAQQQRASSLSQKQPAPELHLHQHHHPTTPPAVEYEPRSERLHPLFVAVYMLFVSLAISVPLALVAAIIESTTRPDVQYIQPQGRW